MDAKALRKIKKYCVKHYAGSSSSRHDMGHIERVRNNALAIVKCLHIQRTVDLNLLQSICYLHDIVTSFTSNGTKYSSMYNHIFEKMLIRKNIYPIIAQFDISPREEKILITSISNHPYSIPYRMLHRDGDQYSKILQDADSLDFVSETRLQQFCSRHPSLSFAAIFFVSFIRKNLRFFLNYPQLENWR